MKAHAMMKPYPKLGPVVLIDFLHSNNGMCGHVALGLHTFTPSPHARSPSITLFEVHPPLPHLIRMTQERMLKVSTMRGPKTVAAIGALHVSAAVEMLVLTCYTDVRSWEGNRIGISLAWTQSLIRHSVLWPHGSITPVTSAYFPHR